MPTTRNNKNKITVVFNLDEMMDHADDEDENEYESPKRAKKAPKTAVKPPPKRRGRAKKLEDFKGVLGSLPDFIRLIDENIPYKNIDVPRLTSIREELIELNALIGLDDIKKSIVEQLVFYLQNMHEGGEMYLNTVIYGPPGTGKTTVAKILGRIFSKLRIIVNEYEDEEENEDGIFECARRDDLIGEYLGSTSTKTAEYLEMCCGGVVFIDEVYSLGNKEGGDSFAKEAIDTINLFLSEHREELMMIVAGYKDEIDQCFFKYNEGLRRRFMWYHTIEPYTSAQLRDIFLSKLNQSGWKWTEGVVQGMLDLINLHKQVFCDNAGSIENFITLLKIKHSNRVLLLPADEKKIITEEDLQICVKEYDKKKKPESFMKMTDKTIDKKAVFVFEFDRTIIESHSQGHPLKKEFKVSDTTLSTLNTAITSWIANQHTIIILTRDVQNEIMEWFQQQLQQKKISFSVSRTAENNSVRIIAPPKVLYQAHLNQEQYWAIWKADQLLLLQEEYTNRPLFYFDYLQLNLDEVVHMTKYIRCIKVPVGDVAFTIAKANQWIAALEDKENKQGKRKRRTRRRRHNKA